MQLSHRPASEEDFPAICGFPRDEEELFFFFPKATWPLTPAQLGEEVDQRSDATVVEADGLVVGFANLYQWETRGRCAIGHVIVDPSARGQGVGRYLMEHMIDLARTRHLAAEVILSCFNRNVAGLLFYPRLGFTPFAIVARTDWRGRPAALIHMRLERPRV